VQRLQVVPQVVCQHGDELLGAGTPSLLGGIASDLLGELGAMGEDADPAAERLRERHILRPEEVGLQRSDHQHAAALPAEFERYTELGADAQGRLHALQFFGILVQRAGDEGFASFVHMHCPPAIRQLQHVEAKLALQRR
jgi:hypothetical protein